MPTHTRKRGGGVIIDKRDGKHNKGDVERAGWLYFRDTETEEREQNQEGGREGRRPGGESEHILLVKPRVEHRQLGAWQLFNP